MPREFLQLSTSRVTTAASLVLVLAAFGFGGFQLIPQVRYGIIFALGRSPLCSFSQAIQSHQTVQSHFERLAKITADSRVVERDPQGLWLWKTPLGMFWVPAGDESSFLWILAEQRGDLYSRTVNGVKPGDIVLDSGAHIGLFAMEALAAGAKLVFAIEPSPLTLVALKRNLAQEIAEGKVVVYEKGIWDRDDFLPFYMAPGMSAGHRVLPGDSESDSELVIKVPVTTIDRLVEELQIERVDFIKMDIEGAEQRALQGATKTLARDKPRMGLAAYHRDDDQIRIPEIVRGARADYQLQCANCAEKDLSIIAQTLLFH